MLISSFDNEIAEDDAFVSDIDEECLIPENFPNCANGKYTEPTTHHNLTPDPDGDDDCDDCPDDDINRD